MPQLIEMHNCIKNDQQRGKRMCNDLATIVISNEPMLNQSKNGKNSTRHNNAQGIKQYIEWPIKNASKMYFSIDAGKINFVANLIAHHNTFSKQKKNKKNKIQKRKYAAGIVTIRPDFIHPNKLQMSR